MGVQVLLLGLGLGGGWLPMTSAHTLFVFPYVLLALADPWARLDPRYERVGPLPGAGPWRVLVRVRLPLLMPALAFAAALGVAVSLSLYLPTVLMGGGRIATLATEAIALVVRRRPPHRRGLWLDPGPGDLGGFFRRLWGQRRPRGRRCVRAPPCWNCATSPSAGERPVVRAA